MEKGSGEEGEEDMPTGDVGTGSEVMNPEEWADETEDESSSRRPGRFFGEEPLDTELGVLPGLISSNTSSGQVRKNISVFTGDITSKAAAMFGAELSEFAGRNKLGPNTVARLLRVILLYSALAATLENKKKKH